jgi:tripartite-type tricarboxylate transporter receptor subunit TctC
MSKKLAILAMIFVFIFGLSSVASEAFPTKEIEIIVPFAAGGGVDIMSRVLAPKLSEILGKPVLVVNKPGAGGTVGTSLATKRKPDGYTLVTISPSSIIFAPYFQETPYHPLRDISYIAGWVNQPLGIQVRADAPWKTFEDILDYAKKNPGKIQYGANFNGYGHIYMEAIAKERGITWTLIPLDGDGEILPSLLGGHTNVATMAVAWVPQARAGKVRPIAFFSEKRLADFPDIPVLNELGFNYPMPAASFILKILESAFKTALNSTEFREAAQRLSLDVWFRNSEEFKETAEKGFKGIGDMIEKLGLKKQGPQK